MVHIISKPTRRELRERLAESASKSSIAGVRGVLRTTEEAFEVSERMEREGEAFETPYAVSGEAPESKQARIDLALRSGFKTDPEAVERLI